jgi:hypothetical protein
MIKYKTIATLLASQLKEKKTLKHKKFFRRFVAQTVLVVLLMLGIVFLPSTNACGPYIGQTEMRDCPNTNTIPKKYGTWETNSSNSMVCGRQKHKITKVGKLETHAWNSGAQIYGFSIQSAIWTCQTCGYRSEETWHGKPGGCCLMRGCNIL